MSNYIHVLKNPKTIASIKELKELSKDFIDIRITKFRCIVNYETMNFFIWIADGICHEDIFYHIDKQFSIKLNKNKLCAFSIHIDTKKCYLSDSTFYWRDIELDKISSDSMNVGNKKLLKLKKILIKSINANNNYKNFISVFNLKPKDLFFDTEK